MTVRKKSKVETSTLPVMQTISLADLGQENVKRLPSQAFAIWIRSLLQNWRQGTVACKGRSDVAYSNKKQWKQKGTGRARAGSARSPLWRGGGVIFGPQPRTRTLTLSQQMKKNVCLGLLAAFAENNRLVAIDWEFVGDKPRTAECASLLKALSLHNEKITLFLTNDDHLLYASVVNLPQVRIVFFDESNAFNLSHSNYWVVLKKDMDHFKEMVSRWS